MVPSHFSARTMTRPIRIAAAQYPLSQFGTRFDYVRKLTDWVGRAGADGADLVVFPEYGAMEYAAAAGAEAASDLAASLEAVSAALPEMDAAHADLAQRLSVHILAASGPCRRIDGRYVNRARLFAPSGKIGVQDKMIMTPFEVAWGIAPGETLRVFDTALGRIGIAICYDSEFPLLVRAQAEAGADLILIPSCTEFVSGFNRVRTAALARALENGCITVQSPTVGEARWSPAVDVNAGAAGIFAPSEKGLSDTGVVAEGRLGEAMFVTATVDLARLREVRTRGEMRNTLDWARQPGARPLAGLVEVVELR
jgi:predicted amidohydrolase